MDLSSGYVDVTVNLSVNGSLLNDSYLAAPDDSTLILVTKWLDDYSTYILLALALILNTAAFVTICFMKPVTSTSVYIAALAVVDTLCLLLKLLVTRIVRITTLPQLFSCGFIFSCFLFVQYMSSFIVVIISAERFVAVWFPFRVNRMFTRRVAFCSLLCTSLIAIPMSVWVFWFYERIHDPSWGLICFHKVQYRSAMAAIRKIHPLVYIVIPLLVITILNVAIIIGLRRSVRIALGSSNGTASQSRVGQRLTIMLLTTCVAFVVLELPIALWGFIKYSMPEKNRVMSNFYLEIAQTLEDTNHTVNFVLYFLAGSKFRRLFLIMILGRTCKDESPQPHVTLTLLNTPRTSNGGTLQPDKNSQETRCASL